MFDLFSWLPMLQDAPVAAPIVEAQQQLVQQLQNLTDIAKLPDTTAKAVQLASSGQGPEPLMQFFGGPGLTINPRMAQSSAAIPSGGEIYDSLIYGPTPISFNDMLYGNGASGSKPNPTTSPGKKPGLTAEQLAALVGMQPKYPEPKFAEIRSGPASQVGFSPFAIQQRPRFSLYDVLRGMR
jgi:hypothetical protein